MFIKHVVLEGFKSYRDRTNIGPFDPHFNAITGFNGSGKSNILDAICFVLGLTSLQTVRATCLADLIYKGGNLTRASVSLVFDNKDKTNGKCPVGYEKYEEIIISRTVENSEVCKYYLNGMLSTKKEIAEMLSSVQLNINQPNFVIMQGKITKVVNMKPKELLFMIEETVGATAYQAKRDKTQKELDDKERQVKNIVETMEEIIFPALNKQQKAAKDIEEFNLLSAEHGQKRRAYHMSLYKEKKIELETRNKNLEKIIAADNMDEADRKAHEEEIKECQRRQKEMEEAGTNFDRNISEAEKEMSKFKKQMLVLQAQLESAKKNEQEAKDKVKEMTDSLQEEKNQMDQFQNKGKALIEEFNSVKKEVETAEENLNAARKLESELKMGAIVDDSGKVMDALKQQQDVEAKILRLQTDIELNEMEQKNLAERLKVAEAQVKKASAHNDIENRYNAAFQRMEEFKKEARRQNYDIETPKDWRNVFAELNQRVNKMEQRKQQIFRQFPNLNFHYKPSPHVDPSKVKGLVFNLIKFKDIDTWGTAFEVAAKGFLMNVVVDDVEIGKYFLKPGVLQYRTTIHPMDVFKAGNTHNHITQKLLDSKCGKGVALKLLDFMEYDPKYHALIASHVGYKVLVETSEIARKVAFTHKFNSVAKNGDSVDPDGIMQGGTRSGGGLWIKAADEIRTLNEQIEEAKNEHMVLKGEQEFSLNYRKALYELETASNLRDQTPRYVAMKEIAEIKTKNETLAEQNSTWKKEKKDLEKEAVSLKHKVDNLDTIKTKLYEKNKNDIKKFEKELAAAQRKFDAGSNKYSNISLDIKSREALIEDCQKDVDKAQAELQDYIEATKKIGEECSAAKEVYLSKEVLYTGATDACKKWQADKKKLETTITKAKEKLHQAEMSKMRRDNERKELTTSVNAVKRKLEELIESSPEIDFDNLPPGRMENAKKLKEEVDFLDTRMITMKERLDFEGAEKMATTKSKIKEADKKLRQVTQNRNKLIEAVNQLDKHKMDLVTAAYDRINLEFDGMMSTLLPESHAKLVPVNPKDLTAGLTIHVCLGGVWKESLTELSGGQRSLVALALVLSLCMYSPAPFYVLDEIDAALDMNHTQNIGCLIRERFKDTQFICVSLKDGMYTNANVLFQTNFTNGRSEVRRCVSSKKGELEAPKLPTATKGQRPGPSRK